VVDGPAGGGVQRREHEARGGGGHGVGFSGVVMVVAVVHDRRRWVAGRGVGDCTEGIKCGGAARGEAGERDCCRPASSAMP
jgi:hypothetical protein